MASSFGTNTTMGASGFQGLDWDTIEAMKKQELESRLKPVKANLESNMEKRTELTTFLTSMTTLNTSFKTLSDYSTYQQRKATVEGSGVNASAGDGLAIQDIKLSVSQLAQNDISQIGGKYASRDSIFSRQTGNLSFYHNGTSYNVQIKAGQTLAEVAQSITDATNGKVKGIIMKTGGDNPFQLMMQTEETGEANRVYFGSTLEGAAVPGGLLKSGTLSIEIGGTTVSLDLATELSGSTTASSSQQNANALVEAIKNKIETEANSGNSDMVALQEKLNSGAVSINVNSKGTGLFLNDASGAQIKVDIQNAKVQVAQGASDTDTDLGFGTKESNVVAQVQGSSAVNGNAISGTIIIGDGANKTEIDLSTLTSAGNSGTKNAEELVNFINNDPTLQTAGITAKYENNRLIINNSNGGPVVIESKTDANNADVNAKSLKALEALGLSAGSYADNISFIADSLQVNRVQVAQDAKFKFNGIDIQRSTNNVDDVISGLSLELTAVTETNKDVIVRIARDDSKIADEVQKFVDAYNEVINKIAELMRYDEETGVAGAFNGSSEMRSVRTQLTQLINSSDINGSNLVAYGIYINSTTDETTGQITSSGTLKFDKEKFEEAFKKDPEAAVSFFRSKSVTKNGVTTESPGIFTKLTDVMKSLTDGEESLLGSLESSLKSENKRLTQQQTSVTEMMESKYDLMAVRFSMADQQIYAMQTKFQSLSMAIQSAMSS